MRTLRNRVAATGLLAVAAIVLTGCGSQKAKDDRSSVTFEAPFGTFQVFVDAQNRATEIVVDSKLGKDEPVDGTIIQPGTDMVNQKLVCSAADSPCVLDHPYVWSSLVGSTTQTSTEWKNPARDTFTKGLQCGRGGCNTLVQGNGYTARIFLNSRSELVSLRLLETSKNFHLNIRLGDGRNVDCVTSACRIWHEGGRTSTTLAVADSNGMETGFQFERPLTWTHMRVSDEGGLDPQILTKHELILASSGQLAMASPESTHEA